MAQLRDWTNRNVFTPRRETLQYLLAVRDAQTQAQAVKAAAKQQSIGLTGQPYYQHCLALTATTDKPVQLQLHLLKKTEKGDTLKLKASWKMTSLRFVDCVEPTGCMDLVLHMEGREDRWFCISLDDKEAFVERLARLCRLHKIHQQIQFLHMPLRLLELTASAASAGGERHTANGRNASNAPGIVADEIVTNNNVDVCEVDYYQALSAREESDLERFISASDNYVTDAANLVASLRNNLEALEVTNIHAIMSSEEQVEKLMDLMDIALKEVQVMEDRVNKYENFLENVEDAMCVMNDKDRVLTQCRTNEEKLAAELQQILMRNTLPQAQIRILSARIDHSPEQIAACTEAALQLDKHLCQEVSGGASALLAVRQHQEILRSLKVSFSQRLADHLKEVFIHQSTSQLTQCEAVRNRNCLAQHNSLHRDLAPYCELMLWLKLADFKRYSSLMEVYCTRMHAVYLREVGEFIHNAHTNILPTKEKKGASATNAAAAQSIAGSPSLRPASHQGSDTSLSKSTSGRSSRSASIEPFATQISNVNFNSDSLDNTCQTFHKIFKEVLDELVAMLDTEISFCRRFFNITADPSSAVVDFGDYLTYDDSIDSNSNTNNISSERVAFRGGSRAVQNEMHCVMGQLFQGLSDVVAEMTTACVSVHPALTLNMLVLVYHQVEQLNDKTSFIHTILFEISVHVKRNFDKYVDQMIQSFDDFKPPRNGKCGILPFIKTYEEFAEKAKEIFAQSRRLNDLEKAHQRLVTSMMHNVQRVAIEQSKTPSDVVIMENFHRLLSILNSIKIKEALDVKKDELKRDYRAAVSRYVTDSLGKPMEKLSNLVDGVDELLKKGVKPDEISYQHRFSSQELRKVLKEYGVKEVKKGLEHLWKKVGKHFCEEENLLQVVWIAMQDEFLKQYSYYEKIIQTCYPDNGLHIDISLNQVLECFAQISKS